MKRLVTAVLFLAILGAGGVAYNRFMGGAAEPKADTAPKAAAAVPVVAAPVVKKPMPVRIETIGTVQPLASVAIKSRIDGQIVKVHFREGQDVKTGDVLFTLDSRAAEAQLRQAEAQLTRDRAQLVNAKREVERQSELANRSIVSAQKFDEVRTTAATLEGTVRADEAALDNMRVLLTYYTILAPIDGRTGAVTLKAGNIVKANDTSFLVTINQIHPIYVSLSVPQRDFTELRSAMAAGTVEAAVQLPGDDKRVEKGQVAFVDNAIDVATGTITVKAVFPNDHEALWPGQFVNIMLTLRVEPEAVVVPTPAVQIGQNGSFVFVVRPDQTAEVRSVETSRTLGNETVIAKGLQPGEQVIVDGQLRVTNGTKVESKPRGEPKKEGLTS